MKRVFALLSIAIISITTAFAQSEKVEVPKGVVYHYADDAANAKAVAAIRAAFVQRDPSTIFGGSLICGPLLWSRYKDNPEIQKIEAGNVTFNVPQYNDKGKVQRYEKLSGKLIQTHADFKIFWTQIMNDIQGKEEKQPVNIAMPKKDVSPLEAFKLVSNGMQTSNNSIDKKNTATMEAFAAEFAKDSAGTAPYLRDAKKTQALSENFIQRVETIRNAIIKESGGYVNNDTATGDLAGKRNFEVSTRLMVEQENGRDLKKAINALRDSLLALPSLNEADKKFLSQHFSLNTDYNLDVAKRLNKNSWEAYLFDHVPVIAVNTILMKYEGDAKNSAGLVNETLYNKMMAANLTIRKLKPEELSYYWAIISFDIDEPIFIVDTGKYRLLFNLSKKDMTLLWIEQMPKGN